MRDIQDFPVVGGRYTSNFEWSKHILCGSPLDLIAEPDNPVDKYAVKVLHAGRHIGYVPNKGQSCSHCWRHVPAGESSCPYCYSGFDMLVEGGLARRILGANVLKREHATTVIEVDQFDNAVPVKGRLIFI